MDEIDVIRWMKKSVKLRYTLKELFRLFNALNNDLKLCINWLFIFAEESYSEVRKWLKTLVLKPK